MTPSLLAHRFQLNGKRLNRPNLFFAGRYKLFVTNRLLTEIMQKILLLVESGFPREAKEEYVRIFWDKRVIANETLL